MSETKHTPGPWLDGRDYDENDGYCILAKADALRQAELCIALVCAGDIWGGEEYAPEEVKANFKLILASPELYAALEMEERVRLHWEETKDLEFRREESEDALKFWEVTERLLPEIAAKCPPLTTVEEADIRGYLGDEDPLPTTEAGWALLRCDYYDTFCQTDGSVWTEAVEAETTVKRRAALAKARGEAS
jgi:hypothetical protein